MDTEQYPQCDRYPPGVEQADVKKREEKKSWMRSSPNELEAGTVETRGWNDK